MRISAERKVERKVAAIAWQKEHSEPSRRANAFTSRNDDQDEIIPEHGRRGRGRLPAFSKSIFLDVRMSSGFSADLAKSASAALFWKKAEKIVGQDITVNPTALPVVLDTNVVVAGLFPSQDNGTASKRLMELVMDGEVAPSVTWAIIGEYQNVLRKFGDSDLNKLCWLLSRSDLIPIFPAIEVPQVEVDPSDTPFIEALVLMMRGSVGNQRPPSRLVTRDNDLLDMVNEEDSVELLRGRIITPGDLLRELKRK